jgi:aspartyl-tRNA(Asn)/glutamyl-tRNA(Gln) amidotransferase subunit A
LKPIALTEQAAAAFVRPPGDFERSDADYRDALAQGATYSGVDYITASYRRADLRSSFLALFSRFDVLVTPTVATTAFDAGALGPDAIDGQPVDPHLGWSPFSWPMNLTGLPAATLPCGFDADGLPIGLQIVAPWLDEATILRVAAAFEQAQPWCAVWPDA